MLLLKENDKVTCINAKRPSDIKFERIYCPDSLNNLQLQNTVIVNLEQELDLIINSFHSETRYEIRRCEKNDLPEVKFIVQPDNNDIIDFMTKYKCFAKDKNSTVINSIIDEVDEMLKLYNNNKIIILSKAYSNINPEEIWVFHIHIVEKGSSARLLASISSCRHGNKNNKTITGRLNRWLHYKEIEFFKNDGYKIYDFGGVDLNNTTKETAQVAQFKKHFSKKIMKYYYAENKAIMASSTGGGGLSLKLHRLFKHKKKTENIAIIYDENTFNIAVEIVNQLACEFKFSLFSTMEYSRKYRKSFDLVHDLTETYEKTSRFKEPAYVPYHYFYARNRNGEFTAGSFKNIENYKEINIINSTNLCKFFNENDVFISLDEKYILESLACGCFVIACKGSTAEKLIKHKINGFIIDNENELDTALLWCKTNLQKLRNNALKNAMIIEEEYSYYKIADTYKKFYNRNK